MTKPLKGWNLSEGGAIMGLTHQGLRLECPPLFYPILSTLLIMVLPCDYGFNARCWHCLELNLARPLSSLLLTAYLLVTKALTLNRGMVAGQILNWKTRKSIFWWQSERIKEVRKKGCWAKLKRKKKPSTKYALNCTFPLPSCKHPKYFFLSVP